MTRFTPEAVEEKYGLTPAQYPDFAALRGDPSDNLPSIPGVGEKTAAKWIREFGSLGALVDRVDEVKGKAGDNLREHLGDVLRNRQLTELPGTCRSTSAPRRPEARCRGTGTQIHQLFDTLQFRVLRDRLYATLPTASSGTAAAATGADARRLRRRGRPARPGRGGRVAGRARADRPRAGLAVRRAPGAAAPAT